MTNNNLYELPATATIAYYDVESDQNLTAEEWQWLHTKSDEITVINKSRGNFVSEKEGYGPCDVSNRVCSSSVKFRFGYEAINYVMGSRTGYRHIYESAEELRNDIINLHSKQGRWATEYFGPLINRRITDFQASEGRKYASFALEQHDKGCLINLKCWTINSLGSEESASQYMANDWDWNF